MSEESFKKDKKRYKEEFKEEFEAFKVNVYASLGKVLALSCYELPEVEV